MSEFLTRGFADVSVRADSEGRTISGMIVPFDRVARVSDGGPSYDEMFRMGAFSKTIRESGSRVKLLYQHNSREPIGKATSLREDPAGLIGDFKVVKTRQGDEALELVRDQVIDSFSVGFAPVKHEKRDGVTVRTEVALREASLVTFPAYSDARIAGIRAAIEAARAAGEPIDPAIVGQFLGIFTAIDSIVDEAQESLAMLLAVPNPDVDDDETAETATADGQPEPRSAEPVSATRGEHIARFAQLRAKAHMKGITRNV